MIIKRLRILIFALSCVMLANPVEAQTNRVKLKFEVDGKEVKRKLKVSCYVNGEVVEPQLFNNGFVVPPTIKGDENMKVRVRSGKYDLFFDSVHASKFGTDWIVGVDNPPFDKENIDSDEAAPPGRELAQIYYIIFVSKKGLDTRLLVNVYKDAR